MLKTLTILFFLLSSLSNIAQSPFGEVFTPPKESPDTLYFAFNEGIQLIVIDNYDTWRRQGSFFDMMYPRGGSWFQDNWPAPRNIYIFRNIDGKIIKVYNSNLTIRYGLKNTDYINTTDLSIYSLQDYRELNNHLMFYAENNKVGLITLKGDVVVPAVYDNIRKYQNDNGKRDKLIIQQDGMFGFLDSNLNVLFQPIYRSSNEESHLGCPEHNIINEQYIKVFKNEKCGLINENGDVLIDFKFDDLTLIYDTLYMGLIYKDKNEIEEISNLGSYWGHMVKTCVLFGKNFSVTTELRDFEHIDYGGIERFIVKKDNKFGVLNHKGGVIVPLEYDSLTSQNENYVVVRDNKRGIINLDGKIVLSIEFDDLYFYDQAIYVTQEGLVGVYNDKYKLIAKPQFEYRTWDMGKYVLTSEDGSKGFVMHQKEGSYYQSPDGEIIKL